MANDMSPDLMPQPALGAFTLERDLNEALPPIVKGGSPPPAPRGPIGKVSYTHEAMIELMIVNPWISNNALAAHFGYSPAWISTIKQSDAFQAKLAERRAQLVDPQLTMSIEERYKALAARSCEVLQERLEQPNVDVNVALRVAEMGGKILSTQLSAPRPAAPQGDRLAELAERLVALRRKSVTSEGVVDVQAVETR